MRITLEADYALRIMCLLSNSETVLDAKTISDSASIPQRFSFKILRKLAHGKMVKSYKGSSGGYKLAKNPENFTLKDVIELIDGPLVISRCSDTEGGCSLVGSRTGECAIHHIFNAVSDGVSKELGKITIAEVADKNADIPTLVKKMKF